jgi:hypothetical protein
LHLVLYFYYTSETVCGTELRDRIRTAVATPPAVGVPASARGREDRG